MPLPTRPSLQPGICGSKGIAYNQTDLDLNFGVLIIASQYYAPSFLPHRHQKPSRTQILFHGRTWKLNLFIPRTVHWRGKVTLSSLKASCSKGILIQTLEGMACREVLESQRQQVLRVLLCYGLPPVLLYKRFCKAAHSSQDMSKEEVSFVWACWSSFGRHSCYTKVNLCAFVLGSRVSSSTSVKGKVGNHVLLAHVNLRSTMDRFYSSKPWSFQPKIGKNHGI